MVEEAAEAVENIEEAEDADEHEFGASSTQQGVNRNCTAIETNIPVRAIGDEHAAQYYGRPRILADHVHTCL